MITIYDAKHYDFSDNLKSLIEEKFHTLLEQCKSFLESSDIPYNPNFTVYIRKTDYLNPYKAKTFFIIEIDSCSLLDFYGFYDEKENKIYDTKLNGIINYHENWEKCNFSKVKLNDEVIQWFLEQQNQFFKSLEENDFQLSIDFAYSSDLDCIPESVVNFHHKNKPFEQFLIDKNSINAFLKLYYDYNSIMESKFNIVAKKSPTSA